MELTVQNVFGLLLRSKLLSSDEARAMFARWQQEAKDAAGNLADFASWMVANKYLTQYQAQLLARGHADGFFLNEYKILERLGKGRMAGVYKAQHQLDQIVAIKVLPPSKAKEATLLGRFHREARLSLLLKHPNIVRAFQTGTAEGLHYIVMEYLEGETLEDVLARRGKLPPGEAVRLIHQALQGLQHIHSQGLVHRDLKPSNMMLVGSNPDSTLRATLKLLDIGLGRTLFDETAGEADLTSEGVLLGTPDYMSPEQARDPRTIDVRADIYSLGCVLYHLLTGQPPFPDTNIISQMIRHSTETPKLLKSFTPAAPDGLQQIVNWMMAKEATQRYPTPERAAQALQVFLAAGNEQLAVPEADPRMRTYLTWLEGSAISPPPAPVRQSGKAKSEKPTKLPAKTSASGERKGSRPKKKNSGAGVSPVRETRDRRDAAPPPPAAGPVEQIDVELVPFDAPAIEAKPVWGWRLSRREILVFGIGALLGAVVTFVGALLAFKHRE
ncbi:MAG TPA: serine/threonine-protein kinase [Gemmataceae bacterium]|nr:serine/threonine-protein kinase [Gemmataceae bacterium]